MMGWLFTSQVYRSRSKRSLTCAVGWNLLQEVSCVIEHVTRVRVMFTVFVPSLILPEGAFCCYFCVSLDSDCCLQIKCFWCYLSACAITSFFAFFSPRGSRECNSCVQVANHTKGNSEMRSYCKTNCQQDFLANCVTLASHFDVSRTMVSWPAYMYIIKAQTSRPLALN